MPPIESGLSTDEMLELDAFLSSSAVPETAMDLYTLEGFLTAVVIGPQLVLPSQWLPWVWDQDAGKGGVAFESAEQAQWIMRLLMQCMNGIVAQFQAAPQEFDPLFDPEVNDGSATDWCDGFLIGTQFNPRDWASLWALKPTLATPLLRLGTEEGVRATSKAGDERKWLDAVIPSLVDIHAYWLARRTDPASTSTQRQPARRETTKVGRNDPCTCGSGKKFKLCCGACNPIVR
jgi:uncharacterized protein